MSYGGFEYAGGPYAGGRGAAAASEIAPNLAVEISFTTDAFATPVWVDVTTDVRSWNVRRGRNRELERFQPGRATVVFGNLDRQYDSHNENGPWYGNLRPMRRMRIRETFDGVTHPTFDGFIDGWTLDYPLTGKDATATVVATDAFKVFNRTDLPRSVYASVVDADSPNVWWHLDETVGALGEGFAFNAGSDGPALDGIINGAPKPGGQGLVAFDPGSSYTFQDASAFAGTTEMGPYLANASLNLLGGSTWSVEAWGRTFVTDATDDGFLWSVATNASTNVHAGCGKSGTALLFFVRNNGFTTLHGVTTPDNFIVPGRIYHVVCVVESGGQMAMYVNGTRYTTLPAGFTSTTYPGSRPASGIFAVGHTRADNAVSPPDQAFLNWTGELDEAAVWDDVALTEVQVDAHYAAGTAPWQDDQPAERIDRVLDMAEWPSDLRALDAGNVALQSAQLGQTVLEHMQKVAETERGLLFVARDGLVRLVDRAAVAARVSQATFGDGGGDEIGYRDITFEDGDTVIRNRATISRLNGVAQQSVDTGSVGEFGRFDYTLDGLFHKLDSYSQTYADDIVAEYAEPRRRVTSLMLGPGDAGSAATLYPQMLGRELGDAVTVVNRPPGTGGVSQVCVIEGIEHSGVPGKRRTAKWSLSPELDGAGVPVGIEGALLLESGDAVLLESGDLLLMES